MLSQTLNSIIDITPESPKSPIDILPEALIKSIIAMLPHTLKSIIDILPQALNQEHRQFTPNPTSITAIVPPALNEEHHRYFGDLQGGRLPIFLEALNTL